MYNCLYILLLASILLITHFDTCQVDIGTAASYPSPYLPTACFRNDPNQFPPGNLFALAGDGIWDNGSSCGRQYLVKCLSSATPNACIEGQTIQIKIIDKSSGVASMVLLEAAFAMIATQNPSAINIEFRQSILSANPLPARQLPYIPSRGH